MNTTPTVWHNVTLMHILWAYFASPLCCNLSTFHSA